MKWLLAVMVVVVYLLHQDTWYWQDRTLVFGFLPIGLAYHAGYSVLCAVMMGLLVRFAWPGHIEAAVADLPETPAETPQEEIHG
jgi:hypothetical protein